MLRTEYNTESDQCSLEQDACHTFPEKYDYWTMAPQTLSLGGGLGDVTQAPDCQDWLCILRHVALKTELLPQIQLLSEFPKLSIDKPIS